MYPKLIQSIQECEVIHIMMLSASLAITAVDGCSPAEWCIIQDGVCILS